MSPTQYVLCFFGLAVVLIGVGLSSELHLRHQRLAGYGDMVDKTTSDGTSSIGTNSIATHVDEEAGASREVGKNGDESTTPSEPNSPTRGPILSETTDAEVLGHPYTDESGEP